MQRRGVTRIELDPIGQHQRDRVAVSHADRSKSAGDPPHARGVLPPRELGTRVGAAESDPIRRTPGGRLKALTQSERAGIGLHRSRG